MGIHAQPVRRSVVEAAGVESESDITTTGGLRESTKCLLNDRHFNIQFFSFFQLCPKTS
jgi:hypothetical protein